MVNSPPANAGDADSIPGLRRTLEEEMATHSSILVWRISRTEEPAELQSTRSQSDRELPTDRTHSRVCLVTLFALCVCVKLQ